MRILVTLLIFFFMLTGAAAQNPPYTLPPQTEINKLQHAILTTTKGKIYLQLFPEVAPAHVANLKYLCDKGFYKGLLFHTRETGYIIQGGSPKNNATGGPGWELTQEFSEYRHERGTLGMARRPNELNTERKSNGSQFHILLRDAPHMNGSYTIIGKVIKGMDVADKIAVGDKILDFRVYVKGVEKGSAGGSGN